MDDLEQAAAAMSANAQAINGEVSSPEDMPVPEPAQKSAPLRSTVKGAEKSVIKRQPRRTQAQEDDDTAEAMFAAFGPQNDGADFGWDDEDDEDTPAPLIVGITPRNWLFQGYYLDKRGALYGEAIRFADIAIPLDREDIAKLGRVLLTQSNSSVETKDHSNAPPSLDMCRKVVSEMNRRRPALLKRKAAELSEAEEELNDHNLPKDERSYMRDRVKALRRYIAIVERQAEITPEMLREWFAREDLALRSAAVPPEMRAAFEVIEREREARDALGGGLGGLPEFMGVLA